jgi:hypothetical protein
MRARRVFDPTTSHSAGHPHGAQRRNDPMFFRRHGVDFSRFANVSRHGGTTYFP